MPKCKIIERFSGLRGAFTGIALIPLSLAGKRRCLSRPMNRPAWKESDSVERSSPNWPSKLTLSNFQVPLASLIRPHSPPRRTGATGSLPVPPRLPAAFRRPPGLAPPPPPTPSPSTRSTPPRHPPRPRASPSSSARPKGSSPTRPTARSITGAWRRRASAWSRTRSPARRGCSLTR